MSDWEQSLVSNNMMSGHSCDVDSALTNCSDFIIMDKFNFILPIWMSSEVSQAGPSPWVGRQGGSLRPQDWLRIDLIKNYIKHICNYSSSVAEQSEWVTRQTFVKPPFLRFSSGATTAQPSPGLEQFNSGNPSSVFTIQLVLFTRLAIILTQNVSKDNPYKKK